MNNLILGIIFSKKFIYLAGGALILWLLFKVFFIAWDYVAFINPKVDKLKNDNITLQLDLKLSQATNDSLNTVIIDCSTTNLLIQDTNQKNIDSLLKANKKLRIENKSINAQIGHFLEIAPCKKSVKIKDGNPFKKNKTEWVLIDCEEN